MACIFGRFFFLQDVDVVLNLVLSLWFDCLHFLNQRGITCLKLVYCEESLFIIYGVTYLGGSMGDTQKGRKSICVKKILL